MKNLIKIFVFFALTISFTGSAYALTMDEYFQQMDRDQAALDSCVAGIPKAVSPSAACQWWRSYDACHLDSYLIQRASSEKLIESESGDDCTIIPTEGGGPPQHYYYSGNQFCIERGIGTPSYTKTCVPRTDIVQPTPIPKLAPAPGFQPLLEKSETQLEIERKNKQLQQELKQAEKELTQKVQEGYQKDRAAGRIIGEETHYGTVEILRDGKITSLDSYIKANAGDIIKTGNDGFMEYGLNNSRTKLGPDTLGVMLGLDKSNKKVITPLDWDKDPSYRPELNHWEFFENTAIDLMDFINQNRPSYLKSCAIGNVYECSWGTVQFIHGGVGWFNEKIEKDFPKNMIVTPTVAMVPIGTEYSVAVGQDGATTVTTLDGEVVVMDLNSRKLAIVGAYQTITIPKTDKGLTTAELQQGLTKVDPGSIDKWWEKKTQEQISPEMVKKIFIGGWVVLFIIILFVKRKQIWPNKFLKTQTDIEKEKIVNEKLEKNRKWLVNNSFWTGVFSTIISLYVTLAPQSSQFILLVKNYWLIFLMLTILGFIFSLLSMKSPRKAFVVIGMCFNIFAIMLWLRIGLIF